MEQENLLKLGQMRFINRFVPDSGQRNIWLDSETAALKCRLNLEKDTSNKQVIQTASKSNKQERRFLDNNDTLKGKQIRIERIIEREGWKESQKEKDGKNHRKRKMERIIEREGWKESQRMIEGVIDTVRWIERMTEEVIDRVKEKSRKNDGRSNRQIQREREREIIQRMLQS